MIGVRSREGDVKLSVISIEMESCWGVRENSTDGRGVRREKERTKYRALGNASVDSRWRKRSGANEDRHATIAKICSE